MQRRRFLQSAIATSSPLLCGQALAQHPAPSPATPPPSAAAGLALLEAWPGPYGGVPPFDRVEVAEFEPTLVEAMARAQAEIDALAADPALPTFANTCAVFDRLGAPMERAFALYSVHVSTLSTPAIRSLENIMSPRLAAFTDETNQNPALFRRFEALHQRPALRSALTAEERRLLDVQYLDFVRRGANLDDAGKSRVKTINQRLASLSTKFAQNQLADEEASLMIDRESDLAGMLQSSREAAAAAAAAAGQPGQWWIANTRSAMEPFLTASTRRELRQRGWRMWVGRGDNGDAHDNKRVVAEILGLRSERAGLLGYASHAHWITEDAMAGTPDAALALMMSVWPAARERARVEIADMQAVADGEGARLRIEAWDYRHYTEKVRLKRYAVDEEAIKPYLQLDRMREAMFWSAGEMHGLSFECIADVPVAHPDITVYRVLRGGDPVGLWYFDPFARTGKNSGAWMNEYRSQRRLPGAAVLPIVSNNDNFIKAPPGDPVLLSWDDAATMFHEFGHALHGLLSSVTYARLAGTSVKRDFVEFPSQLNERCLQTKEVLGRFAVHHRTGQPMPAGLVAAIERSHTFNQGFATCEYLASAIYDMRVHLAAARGAVDPVRFERELMSELECPREIVMRHRPTHFGHIFAGEGYSAGYYAYLWADVLTADAAEAFVEAGSHFDKATSRRLRDTILSVGNTVAPEDAYRRFRGRDARPDALMRNRGFAGPQS